jgi:sensor histidine kinase regulating citrate/malate metabolism
MSESIIDDFITVISELCQNIFEHSMESGYISMQTYSVGKGNTFCLAICDSGIGIKESLKNRVKEGTNGVDCIKLALFTPVSSKRDFGFGLCQVNSIVETLNGSIFIRSHDTFVMVLYNAKKYDTGQRIFYKTGLNEFQGTQIAIAL